MANTLPPDVSDTPIVCDWPCPHQALDPTPTNTIPNPCKWPRDGPSVENIRDPVKHTNRMSLPFQGDSIKSVNARQHTSSND